MDRRNRKVFSAILSCFLIAFVIQGILKICGIFVFEKALNWGIFGIIDKNLWMQICYHSTINLIAIYCLSFSLNIKPYSDKWYHYLIIFLSAFGITACRMLLKMPFFMEFVYDTILYIVIPTIVNLTISRENRICIGGKFSNIITSISIQIILYFCYLGLCYWSSLLSSRIIAIQTRMYVSTHFLIFFELYIGLILMMLSLNNFIFYVKEKNKMIWPSNIATEKARKERILKVKLLKQEKLKQEIAELETRIAELEQQENESNS